MVAGLGLGSALLLAPLDASACSCAGIDPWDAYARSDAAIIGVYEGKRGPTTYLFRVEEDYKVELPAELEVQAAEHGASCGIEARVGQRLGLFLARDGGRWHSNLCSQARPAQVRIAAKGLPKPNGKGPVRFLVGGGFGPARVQALDAQGRTLAYGREGGGVSALAVCPGSRRSVEIAGPRVAIRDLTTFRVVREVGIGRRRNEWTAKAHCLGPDAYVALLGDSTSRIVRIRGRTVRTLRTGQRPAAAFAARKAFISTRSQILSVDLRTGRSRAIADFTADQLAVSPDGTLLAALTDFRLVVIRVQGRRQVIQGPFVSREDIPHLVWDRHRLAVLGWNGGEVYDERLQMRGKLPSWGVSDAVGIGGRIAGVGYGALRVARLLRGPVRLVRDLVSPNTFAIAAVDGGPNIRLAGRLPCARG